MSNKKEEIYELWKHKMTSRSHVLQKLPGITKNELDQFEKELVQAIDDIGEKDANVATSWSSAEIDPSSLPREGEIFLDDAEEVLVRVIAVADDLDSVDIERILALPRSRVNLDQFPQRVRSIYFEGFRYIEDGSSPTVTDPPPSFRYLRCDAATLGRFYHDLLNVLQAYADDIDPNADDKDIQEG